MNANSIINHTILFKNTILKHLADSECSQMENPHRNLGSPKQIHEKIEKTNHDRLFEATEIQMGVIRLGTHRIREKLISIEMGCSGTLYN